MTDAPKISPEWRDSAEAPISFFVLLGKILATVAHSLGEGGETCWLAEIHASGDRTTKATRPLAKQWVEDTIEKRRHETEDYITVEGICPIRSTPWSIKVRREGYDAWKSGTLIQKALPELTDDQRETLISGMSPEGFAMMFGKEEGEVGGNE